VDEHVPGRLKDERDGGGVRPIQIFWIGATVDFGAADVFGATSIDHVAEIGVIAAEIVVAGEARGTFAAGHSGSKNDFLADVDGVHFGADFGDFTGDIASRDVRERNGNTRQAPADPEVEVVQGAGADTNEDVIGAEMRFNDVGVMEDARFAVLVEDDGFHKEAS
jgi:hypothetical protein